MRSHSHRRFLDDGNELQLAAARAALTPANEASLRALGENFASVWESGACPMTLKKRIARTLIQEIVVDVVDNH